MRNIFLFVLVGSARDKVCFRTSQGISSLNLFELPWDLPHLVLESTLFQTLLPDLNAFRLELIMFSACGGMRTGS